MENTLSLLKAFCSWDFVERDCQKTLSVLTQDIQWFGTSDHEDVHSIEEAERYVRSEIKAMPTPYQMTILQENYTPTSESTGVAFLRVVLENEGVPLLVRATAASRMEDGVEKLCSMHLSVADAAQQADEFYPIAKHKEEIAQMKRKLVASTIPGGLTGAYLQKDLPFYFINQRMLDYLGYTNESEFVSAIGGMIINAIHPSERDAVYQAIAEQLTEGNRYAVDYRMKRKDGSYIWLHDIGQRTLDEKDKDIIISVCYDITPEHEKQAQLDNLINAMPGGVALYKQVNGRYQMIYFSKGVCVLSGHSPAEFEALVQSGLEKSVCPEDADKVFAAFQKAAGSDEVVSLDYRIPHIDGEYVWISGSFKRTGIEDGYPIIHAAFTEMPQQRKLMNSLTEDSSIGIIVSDNATRELLYINPAVRKMLEIEDSSYTGKVCYEYLLGYDEPCSFCERAEYEKGGDKENIYYLPHIDKYLMARGKLMQWAGREARVEYLTDITAEKKAQEQLKDLVQNISCGIIVSRASTTDGTYEIQYMNEGFCRLFEDTEENLRARYQSDLTVGVHPEDLKTVARMTQELLGGKDHAEGTLRITLVNGKTKSVRLEINALRLSDGMATIYATYSDVTTQMQQEQQLRDVIHNVPGGICLYRWNGVKLLPMVVSEQFSETLGIDAKAHLASIKGMNFEMIHPDDLSGARRVVEDAVKRNGKSEYTCRLLNAKTKAYRWICVQGNTICQPDGTSFIYVHYTDITQERRIAQKLRASERALDAATEHADLWYWSYDPSTGQAFLSPRCSGDSMVPAVLDNYPHSWLDLGFIMPEYEAAYREAVSQAEEKNAHVVFEAQIALQDGSTHWAEFRFTNLPDEDEKSSIVVCTARVIDEQKALQAKYEMEKQKALLGEKGLLLHAEFNLHTGKTLEYKYADVFENSDPTRSTMADSIALVERLIVDEKGREQFLGLNDADYLNAQLQQGNIDFSLEYRRKMPTGQIIWVRNVLHLVCEPNTGETILFEYCYDIHQQKMAEEVLRSSTTYDYESISSVSFSCGKIMYYGEGRSKEHDGLLDYEEIRQSYAKDVVLPGEREAFLLHTDPGNVMAAVVQNGFYEFLTKTVEKDGTIGTVKSRFVPYDMENNIYILTRINVTAILKEEAEKNEKLSQALEVARQANHAKSDFLSAMSHDIRTPMNAIVGMCELALEDEQDAKQVHESLETIQSSSSLLLSLINNILDMSRIESGKMVMVNEPFSLTGQIQETAASYQSLTRQKQQKFNLDIDVTHDSCIGDIARIHSALDNILSNAIKYTPAGGVISYRITEHPSGKPGIGVYRFEIADTGIGISPEKQERLFEPFYRGETDLTSKIEGTGLGLSIAKAILDLKGGTISVKSEEGVGTTFVVELPLHIADSNEKAKEQRQSAAQGTVDLTGKHILLCEDHPVNQKVIEKILKKVQARVTVAENGQVGYEKFTKSDAGTFDLILMDIQMPQMNGYEATMAIRESHHPQAKTIPIVALSANAFAEDVQKSLRAGMNAHLAKPVEPKTVFEVLNQFILPKDRQ
ncbi:PAS domain-containing protein [Eubacterium barkeri]|uniref:Stage 0 sporulation protein A homolog n=1 Tax=Eubacterium barkeri TaxID=1528 RepID=A0A1H3F8A6_EUBBA|nr:PAS domain-containing protein [Eubacterium barkeri]SDX87212.1 PAS domain S-box-containing protein [Eubacterium barkeri]